MELGVNHHTSGLDDIIIHRYQFTFDNGEERVFRIKLHAQTLNLIQPPRGDYPQWTDLDHNQCPNCPLNKTEHPQCPIAVNLVDLLDFFKDALSYEKVHVAISNEARTYFKDTSLQEGVSSLLGLLMATSGCPIMDKMKPMVRTHLPFTTASETVYRLLSMYLLAQYFLYKRGKEPDLDLRFLKEFFQDIQVVNKHFWNRFASATTQDASLNALVRLDNLAQYAALTVDEDMLLEVELLFNAYFD